MSLVMYEGEWTPRRLAAQLAGKAVGTRRMTPPGYVLVKLARDDWRMPMAQNKQWVLEHRAVMAESIGRLLTRQETVHHRNGVRTDNRVENLELWASSHPPGQRVSDLEAIGDWE
jgi:hypothetical protein